MNINRRQLIRALLMAPGAVTSLAVGARGHIAQGRKLILIELQGGNDGLNTIVPLTDPLYRKLRPTIGLSSDDCLSIAGGIGMHPNLRPFMPLWRAGEMAVVQGLGYEHPNRSHFRSTDIWTSASDSLELKTSGWLADALSGKIGEDEIAAVVFGGRDSAFRGGTLSTISLRSLSDLAVPLPHTLISSDNAAARVISRVRHITSVYQKKVSQAGVSGLKGYPDTYLGRQASEAMALTKAGLSPSIVQLHQKGYDTHADQITRQEVLFDELSSTVAALRRDLIADGKWQNTLIVTLSEFGRRAAENGSGGTDHGTAAPQFIFGGRVKGGFYGKAPSLVDLQSNDLIYTVDFRSMYATILQDWLAISDSQLLSTKHDNLQFIHRG